MFIEWKGRWFDNMNLPKIREESNTENVTS
jgi:hypothetical protein